MKKLLIGSLLLVSFSVLALSTERIEIEGHTLAGCEANIRIELEQLENDKVKVVAADASCVKKEDNTGYRAGIIIKN